MQTEQRSTDDTAQLRRSLLDLQTQIETMRTDMARMTGQNEQLARTVSEMQQRQTDLDDKLRKSEPSKVSVDGREFTADPKENRISMRRWACFARASSRSRRRRSQNS